MSKELIEQMRKLSASRKPYATGAHGQIIGMESYRIVANGFALECIDEAADRIEELERDLLNLVCRIHRDGGHYIAKYGEAKAIADADIVAAQNNADLDALQADNARLREALACGVRIVESYIINYGHSQILAGLRNSHRELLSAAPKQSLAAYRNKVIEECAKRAEAYAYMSQNFNALAEELRAMKEQP